MIGIDVDWYDDTQTTLHVVYGKSFSLEDFYASIDTSYMMMESVSCIIDIVQDLTDLSALPPNVFSILRYVEGKAHPRRGITIVVGMNRFVKVMFDVGKTIAPKSTANYRFVNTRDEAHQLLMSLRQARNQQTEK